MVLTFILYTFHSIALAIVVCGPVSGPHINPCFTICFALFKGFPWRKVPQYIASQIFGGFIAGLLVYVNYKQPLDQITDALKAAGLEAQIFTPEGVCFSHYGLVQSLGAWMLTEIVLILLACFPTCSLQAANSKHWLRIRQ